METDFRFLAGAVLLQVCIGENELILRFDRQISITIESRFRIHSEGEETIHDDAPSSAARIVQFLGNSVEEAEVRNGADLYLAFSSVAAIEVYNSVAEYESYQVQRGSDIYVV